MNELISQAAANRAKFAVKSYTIACGYPKRNRSLVDDARFDTIRNRELAEERRQLVEQLKAARLLPRVIADDSDDYQNNSELDGNIDPWIGNAGNGISQPGTPKSSVKLQVSRAETEKAIEEAAAKVLTPSTKSTDDFPRHISQLDGCHHLLIKYEPELDPTHPGFKDLEYRARRKEVAQIAFDFRYGQRIPEVVYNERELATWRYCYVKLKEAYEKYACEAHNKALAELEAAGLYSPETIPQLEDVSEFLCRRTGWRLRPAAGLLSARDFLASLAFRVFQTTQYIRHWGNPEHSVEPDCIHELMGHIPILCDPSFARFSQEIGLASLGASDEQIEHFATLYWFTVEFGLCREQGQLKCYGAGLLSSFGEMEHALESGQPQLKEFVPEETAIEVYDDAEYQVTYYVAQSYDDAKQKIKDYANKNLKRTYELAYDPYTLSVIVLDSMDSIEMLTEQIKGDYLRLSSAVSKLKTSGFEATNMKRSPKGILLCCEEFPAAAKPQSRDQTNWQLSKINSKEASQMPKSGATPSANQKASNDQQQVVSPRIASPIKPANGNNFNISERRGSHLLTSPLSNGLVNNFCYNYPNSSPYK